MKKFLKVIPLILFSFLSVLHAQVFGTYSTATGALNPPGNPAGILLNWPFTGPVIVGGLTASGSVANDFSGSTGTFLTSTGANTFSGAATDTDATTPSFITASGKTNTGFIGVNGKTSGAVKLTCADATAKIVTISVAAQTVNPATVTIPDLAGNSVTQAFLEKAQTFTATQTFSNAISDTAGVNGISGSSTAAAGVNGETISQQRLRASALSLTTGTAVNVTATPITIPTSGHWKIYVSCGSTGTSATGTYRAVSISTTSATVSSFDSGMTISTPVLFNLSTSDFIQNFVIQVTTTGSTVYYLVDQDNFSSGTSNVYGTMTAVRVY